MQFEATRNSSKRSNRPIVTVSMIGLSIALYAAIAVLTEPDQLEIYQTFGLVAHNAQFSNMFTSIFLHANVYHLASNMVLLWLFGRTLEKALGPVEYLMLYVGSGLFAGVTHLVIVYLSIYLKYMPPDASAQPSVGASGAIAGIMGMYAIRFVRQRVNLLGLRVPSSLLLLGWIFAQSILGAWALYTHNSILLTTDYWAHIGGFVFGTIVAHLTHKATLIRKEYLIDDAEDTFKRGTLLDVVRKYESLLMYDPYDAFANAELGRTWALLDDEDEAAKYYDKAARLYLKTGRGAEAITRCLELVRLLPDAKVAPDLLYHVGCYLESSDRYSDAVQAFETVRKWHPNAQESEMALLKIAEIELNKLQHADLALTAAEEFIQVYPDSESRHFAEQILDLARKTATP